MSTLQERLEMARQIKSSSLPNNEANNDSVDVAVGGEYVDEYDSFKKAVHAEIIEEINYNDDIDPNNKEQVRSLVDRLVETLGINIPKVVRDQLRIEILDETMGFGPLEVLLRDPSISEIMVNGPHQVYVEQHGKLALSDVQFRDDEHVLNVIDRIISPLGRRCDESSPMVDARLPDGSRVNAIIPPCSLVGPSITIRKFSKETLKISDLIGFGSVSQPMAAFLEACVKGKANMVVFGGTGSGKTTLLNVLSQFIPEGERIVTVEDAAELQLTQPHVVTLESRPPNVEGTGAITIRDLVKNCLRMRPDRIIVGECRSGETLDMLQAMNTGHDGSLTTTHANTSRDLLSRLETMVLMAGMGLPSRAIREQIASAFDVVVHQSRLRDGSRKIMEISEVVGMEGDTIIVQDIFVFEQTGVDLEGHIKGRFKATGIRPHVIEKLQNEGVMINDNWFRV